MGQEAGRRSLAHRWWNQLEEATWASERLQRAGPVSERFSAPTLQTADRQYMEGFNDELEAFKERVRGRAKLRIEKAMKEYEEEERKKRLGPGGLDPVEVYESLPEVRLPCPEAEGGQQVGCRRAPHGTQALSPGPSAPAGTPEMLRREGRADAPRCHQQDGPHRE